MSPQSAARLKQKENTRHILQTAVAINDSPPPACKISDWSLLLQRLLGNTDVREALLEGVGLKSEQTAVVKEGSGVPGLGVEAAEETGVAGETLGLGDTPRVAEDDVLLVADDAVSEDGVGVVGNDVSTVELAAGGVGEGRHGVDGLVVQAVGTNQAHEGVGRVVVALVVVGSAAVDLSHGLDGVTAVSLGDVGLLGVGASDPLGEGLLVERGPDVSTVA